jgi:hypothetical protein
MIQGGCFLGKIPSSRALAKPEGGGRAQAGVESLHQEQAVGDPSRPSEGAVNHPTEKPAFDVCHTEASSRKIKPSLCYQTRRFLPP